MEDQPATGVSSANSRRIVVSIFARASAVHEIAIATLSISAEGQITLDHDLLKHLGVRPGQQITIEELSDGQVVMKAFRPTGKISDVFGLLKRKDGPSLSIEEMTAIGPPTP